MYNPSNKVYCFKVKGDKKEVPFPQQTERDRNQLEIRIKYCNNKQWNTPKIVDADCDDALVASGNLWVGAVIPGMKYSLSDYNKPATQNMNSYFFQQLEKENWHSDNFYYLDKVEIKDDRGIDFFYNIMSKILGRKAKNQLYFFESKLFYPQNIPIMNNRLKNPVFLTSQLRIRLEAKFEETVITRRYQEITTIATNISGSLKAITVAVTLLTILYIEFQFKKHLVLSLYNDRDPKIPSDFKLRDDFSFYAKVAGKEKFDEETLTWDQKSKLQVYKALEKIYDERVDIVSNLRLRTVNNAIIEAQLTEEQMRLLPLAYINKVDYEKKQGLVNARRSKNLSIEDSMTQFRNFEPKNEYEKQIYEWLNIYLPKELLDDEEE